MTKYLDQASWDWLTHTDDYLVGRIDVETFERRVETFMIAYERAGEPIPEVLRPGQTLRPSPMRSSRV